MAEEQKQRDEEVLELMFLEDLEEEWVAQQATHPAHRPSSPMDESDEENPCPFYVYTVEVSDISDDEEGGDSKEDDSKEDEEDDSKDDDDDDSKDDDDDSKEDEEDDAMDDGISKMVNIQKAFLRMLEENAIERHTLRQMFKDTLEKLEQYA